MTGTHWLNESGLLSEPVALTNSHQVGTVRDSLIAYAREHNLSSLSPLAVVAETYDGWLNDIDAFHVTKNHVYQALSEAAGGPVAEGNVGGGTGMICHEFKGGIGTASRQVDSRSGPFTVGVLVQANYGDRHQLRVAGVPVGQKLGPEHAPRPWHQSPYGGSIIAVIATDAPLLPIQCKRLAQRATVGLGRVGGVGHHSSGDIFLAFATGNNLPTHPDAPRTLKMLPQHHLNPFFEAVAEAVEEAILNALTVAETMTGFQGRTVYALPLDEMQRIVARFRPE
jgi:D-aminopeptidase